MRAAATSTAAPTLPASSAGTKSLTLAATSRRSVGRVGLSSITNRAPGARPAPDILHCRGGARRPDRTPGGVEAVSHPFIADPQNLTERDEHLEQVLDAVLDYVGAIVGDTSHVAPGGSIDRKYLLGLVSDLAGDVAGSIANAADDLATGRVR
jgi:hypothetical protein